MSKVVVNQVVVGQSGTNSQNFLIDTDVAGALRIRRGSDGSLGTVLNIDSSGRMSSVLTQGTAINTTSGTAHDFTGIPSWAKRITVMFNGVSTNGTSYLIVRGGGGSVEATSYSAQCTIASTVYSDTTGFIAYPGAVAAATTTGVMVLTLLSSNTWVCSSSLCPTTTTAGAIGVGVKTFSGALDRIRLTTLNGTDTFDAGSVNILYEG